MAENTAQTRFKVVASVKKQDALVALTQSNQLEVEDAYIKHLDPKLKDQVVIPPYDPEALRRLVQENDALAQCIDAMEVNIDGTGFQIVSDDDEEETDKEDEKIKEIEGFFKEVWPGESFVTQRRALRRDVEEVGYAFLEIIRNPSDEILFTRILPAHTVRLIKLDDAIPVDKVLIRNGREVKARVSVRERRFIQRVGDKYVFFREYGTSRDVNKTTGEWAGDSAGARLKAAERGSELLYFIGRRDSQGPYGVPRWVTQLPSVIGSRRAEEMNLDYFDNDGIPPALIFLQGTLSGVGTKETVESVLNVKKKDRTRAAVVEISSSEGSLDHGGSARVQVERFAAEQQNDSMFDNYDDKCEKRVRSAFRLPPLFVGRTEGYNYATAYASYTVAEAQVFKPEREEFDEKISITLLRGLGYAGYVMKSNPLSISDAVVQLKGVEMTKDVVSGENRLDVVNAICNTTLQFDKEAHDRKLEEEKQKRTQDEEDRNITNQIRSMALSGQSPTGTEPTPPGKPQPSVKVEKLDKADIFDLAHDYATLLHLRSGDMTPELKKATREAVALLGDEDRVLLDYILGTQIYQGMGTDPEGLSELANAACHCIEG